LLVVVLHRRSWLPQPSPPAEAATSNFQQNSNSKSFSQVINYYYTTGSHDNSYCGWLYNLIFGRRSGC
jgi:hypothetical protein